MAIEVKMTKMFKLEAGLVFDYHEGDFHDVVTILEVDLRQVKYTFSTDGRPATELTVSFDLFLDDFADKVDGLTQYESKVV